MRWFSLHKDPRLLLVVLTALAQGALLLWLHMATEAHRWPATSASWLVALYAASLFVPVTIQLLSSYWRSAQLWWVAGVMAILFFYFGWHFGSNMGVPIDRELFSWDQGFVFFCISALIWLHFLPFLRVRFASGRWRCEYDSLFAAAWQQAIMLAEAALFTGLFWALLMLWAGLFNMLGYGFFQWFFTVPTFAYPFTAVAFSVALYLTDSLERMVTVVREQLLGLLKWLAPVAGVILILFAPTLLLKLPTLVFHGERAIGAGWLLWLLAFTVLLLNAGYQNGRIEQPYPRGFGLFLRIVIPATVVVAATALYSTLVRVAEYGVTVSRVFAVIVALAGVAYAIGYTFAAVRRGPWLKGIERINVGMAIGIIVVLALTLTPIASPYRLSANSQSARALALQGKDLESALRYLRFDTGVYGQRALKRLANLTGDDKQIQEVRRQAGLMLDREHPYQPYDRLDPETAFANLAVYPKGRQLDPKLVERLRSDYRSLRPAHAATAGEDKLTAILIDLNADSAEECIVIASSYYTLYARDAHGWKNAGGPASPLPMNPNEFKEALVAEDFAALPPQWQDLRIGKHRLKITGAPNFRPERPVPPG